MFVPVVWRAAILRFLFEESSVHLYSVSPLTTEWALDAVSVWQSYDALKTRRYIIRELGSWNKRRKGATITYSATKINTAKHFDKRNVQNENDAPALHVFSHVTHLSRQLTNGSKLALVPGVVVTQQHTAALGTVGKVRHLAHTYLVLSI